MPGMATALCPTCGTARTGSFRFCRSCGLDFDAPVASAAAQMDQILAATPAPTQVGRSGTDEVQQPPAGDVIVIQIRKLKLWAGLLVGGLIGLMVAGAVVVPFFGEDGVLLGSVAGIVTVLVSAWLGLRFVQATVRR